MRHVPYLPLDEFTGTETPNLDLAADFLELAAMLSESGQALSQDIVDALELATESEFEDVDEEMKTREEIVSIATARMSSRKLALSESYPFFLDKSGNLITFAYDQKNLGQTAYLISLILSNLNTSTDLLTGFKVHPNKSEVSTLRQYFQYFATAAIAGEIGGPAWSFGFPRPDKSGFVGKLSEIWSQLKDGRVQPSASAPKFAKDDQIDIFACGKRSDDLPGFLLVAAQVATGKNWKNKSIENHVNRVFVNRWFSPSPATRIIAYHVIPFARPDEFFHDDVLVVGNVLHRIRVPRRVEEATTLVKNDVAIEAFDELNNAAIWMQSYLRYARTV